jgi:uncharacterized protein
MIQREFVQILSQRLQESPRFMQIILGPRQVGKTTGVLQLAKKLNNYHLFYFSADEIFNINTEWLKQKWLELRIEKNKKKILIIDEIQLIPNWSQAVKALWDEDKKRQEHFHVLLLGSSSLELHQGLSESLAGRFELIHVTHWGWKESVTLKKNLTLNQYLKYGGYPELLNFEQSDRRKAYLKNSIIEPVISKDILQNVTVKKPALFKQTFELACCYGGQIISLNKLLGQLQEGGNIDLVKYYLSLLEKAFLIKTIPKFSTNNLQKRGSSPKIIPLALALMDLFEVEDKGRIFEVAVGIELLQHFDQVYYWRDKNDEVDYIVKIGKKIIGIEVKSGNKRQLQGLNAFAKKFPTAKTLLVTEENFTSVVEIVHLL